MSSDFVKAVYNCTTTFLDGRYSKPRCNVDNHSRVSRNASRTTIPGWTYARRNSWVGERHGATVHRNAMGNDHSDWERRHAQIAGSHRGSAIPGWTNAQPDRRARPVFDAAVHRSALGG